MMQGRTVKVALIPASVVIPAKLSDTAAVISVYERKSQPATQPPPPVAWSRSFHLSGGNQAST